MGVTAPGATIDRFTTKSDSLYLYSPSGSLALLGHSDTYSMSDGSSWQAGAGVVTIKTATLDHVEVSGNSIRYILRGPSDGLIYSQIEYDSGSHSTQGFLRVASPLVLLATIGGTTATLSGTATVVSNDPIGLADFCYYTAIPNAQVPFQVVYTLNTATWQPNSFDTAFLYSWTGSVDFAHPSSAPALLGLTLLGPTEIPSVASIPYAAVAQFEGGIRRDVSSPAVWKADPPSVVTMAAGVLSTGTFETDRQPVVITATFTSLGVTMSSEKNVLGRLNNAVTEPDTWPMYQFDERHTGYVPRSFDPGSMTLRWQKSLPHRLNPVTAADGRVFVSSADWDASGPQVFALDSQTGATLWTKDFGYVFSVNPPSVGYGTVYVQVGNSYPNSWLYAFDSATGTPLFQSRFGAQWESYFAPTIYKGSVYIDGGNYGGMYAFDAYSGVQRWFAQLPQYDEWTPGVAGSDAYAYVGFYNPGLYVFDRNTGQQQLFIADPNFLWNGWSMNLAPVILDNGDALAIHDGRIIRFDVAGQRVAWEQHGSFSGQPSVARGVIYAVNGGHLVALDEVSGTELWRWPKFGTSIVGSIVVSDSHAFVSTGSETDVVDLVSHESVWSYPASGTLALADGNLYIAQQWGGTLTAISAPSHATSPPVSIELKGPGQAIEMTSVPYLALVHYADGRVADRTERATWTVAPSNYATIAAGGMLSVSEMLDLSQDVTIMAVYSEGGTTVQSSQKVHVVVSVTLAEFVERNRSGASSIQLQVTHELEEAIDRERAILRALGPPPVSGGIPAIDPFRRAIGKAILASEDAQAAAQRAVDQLAIAAQVPTPATGPLPAPVPMSVTPTSREKGAIRARQK